MKAKTLLPLGCACPTCQANGGGGCVEYPDSVIPAGTVIDAPDAYKLVYAGAAVSEDEECASAVKLTPRQLEMAQRAQRRASAGIHPEDFEAFDAGVMSGYYPDGQPIPGPNASNYLDDDEEGLWIP